MCLRHFTVGPSLNVVISEYSIQVFAQINRFRAKYVSNAKQWGYLNVNCALYYITQSNNQEILNEYDHHFNNMQLSKSQN